MHLFIPEIEVSELYIIYTIYPYRTNLKIEFENSKEHQNSKEHVRDGLWP